MEGKKLTRSTNAQLRKLITYMSHNPQFANSTGEFSGPLGSRKRKAQWRILKDSLKDLGPDKSIIKWEQTWRDLKRKARNANAEASSVPVTTQPAVPMISEMHSVILKTIGRKCSTGIGPNGSAIGPKGSGIGPKGSGIGPKESGNGKKDESREPKPKKLRPNNFTIVKKCCINLVKTHGRSVTLFDDLAFRELIDLIPMTLSEKQTLTSQYIQRLLDDDQLADVKKHGRSVTLFDDLAFRELIDLIPMTQSEKQTLTSQYIQRLLDDDQLADETMDKTTDDVVAADDDDDDNDDNPLQEIKGEAEVISCTCGKDTDESMSRHTVECPALSQQTYWNFFEVSLDSATCQICKKTLMWTEISTLKEHLQNYHPSVDFIDDDEEFQKGPPSEDESTNDLGMEEVYLDETILESEQTTSAAKRRRKRAKAALNITGPITRENIALSLQRFKSLDSFGQYVASLMKLIPKDKCIKFQIQIVERLLQEQAAAG